MEDSYQDYSEINEEPCEDYSGPRGFSKSYDMYHSLDSEPLTLLHALFVAPIPFGAGLLSGSWILGLVLLVVMIILDVVCVRSWKYTIFFVVSLLGILIAIADLVLAYIMQTIG